MTAWIDAAFYAYRFMLPTEEQRQQLSELHGQIDRQSLSAEFLVPVGEIDLNVRNYSTWPSDGYELGYVYRNTHTEGELCTYEGVLEAVKELEECCKEAEEQDKEELNDQISGWLSALECPAYDEVMYNYVWRPREELDEQLARSLQFGLLYIVQDFPECYEGEVYMGLQGCGMNLEPRIVAYCALRYQVVNRSWTRYFSNASEWGYFEYVVGKNTAGKVLEALGVPEPRG